MGAGRQVSISLDAVRDKNVMQLKKLNIALFPVCYNDKYYVDALASGDFTKLGLWLFLSFHIYVRVFLQFVFVIDFVKWVTGFRVFWFFFNGFVVLFFYFVGFLVDFLGLFQFVRKCFCLLKCSFNVACDYLLLNLRYKALMLWISAAVNKGKF